MELDGACDGTLDEEAEKLIDDSDSFLFPSFARDSGERACFAYAPHKKIDAPRNRSESAVRSIVRKNNSR